MAKAKYKLRPDYYHAFSEVSGHQTGPRRTALNVMIGILAREYGIFAVRAAVSEIERQTKAIKAAEEREKQ